MLNKKKFRQVIPMLFAVAGLGVIGSSCSTSSGPLVERTPLPVVVQIDGESQKTHGRVWRKGASISNKEKAEEFKEENGPVYDQAQKKWFAKNRAENVRIIVDNDDTWWVAAEEGMFEGRDVLTKTYPGVSAVSFGDCGVDEACDLRLRVRKDAANVENIENVLWEDWYEVRATIPSDRKEYEKALQTDPKAKGHSYIRINFDDDGVSAEYIRGGYVESNEPVDIQPVEDAQ